MTNFRLKIFYSYILVITFLCSCNGQTGNKDVCKTNYINARNKFNKFYIEKNPVLLSEALQDVEKSLDCPITRPASIELKISVLYSLKEYNKAYQFIDSLEEKDFSKPYEKKMQYNFFKALDCEAKSQDEDKKKYFGIAILEIQNFINHQKLIDQKAYYDLFLVKSKVLNEKQFNEELNNLKIKYPNDQDFFEVLKESFTEKPKQVNAVVN
jgi:hypothetical protein